MLQVKSDTTNRISVISTILGRMDRNIDGNMATGLDGEDENLIVDFADSTFNRVFLFFYIPDLTAVDVYKMPTRFMTGWGDFAQLAERIYWFGANSTQSNIWPMYSAEDSLSPLDENIYLGRWLQGTGTWTNQHYLTECQNLFRVQIPWFIQNVVPTYSTSWSNSLTISGDAFFKYGLNVLDSLRNQDRFANFYTRQACYQYRIANPGNASFENLSLKTEPNKSSCIIIKSDEDFNQFKSDQEKESFLISADGKSFHLQEEEFKTLTSGLYFIKSRASHHYIVILK